jgi:hypothetical protein
MKAGEKKMPRRTSLEVMRVCGPLFKISRVERFGIKWPCKKPTLVKKGLWLLENGETLAAKDMRGRAHGKHDMPIYVGAESRYMWMSALRAYIRSSCGKHNAK